MHEPEWVDRQGGRRDGPARSPQIAPPSTQATVLLVEQDPTQRIAARDLLAGAGFRVVEARDPDAAMVILMLRDDVLVVVANIEMPGLASGAPFAELLGHRAPWMSVVRTCSTAPVGRWGPRQLGRLYADEALVQIVRAAADAARQLRGSRRVSRPLEA
jgi:CheY-like chemotaxis protein